MKLDRKQIPYLLALLDDDSVTVQKTVRSQLASLGPDLEQELANCSKSLNPTQSKRAQEIVAEQRRASLKKNWPNWMELGSDEAKLEEALRLISEYQNGTTQTKSLKQLLDQVAENYAKSHAQRDVLSLAKFLFQELGIQGNREDYYNPQNSDLSYVIEKRKGIPISLVSLYILVAARLGLHVEGCNFPGHFLARVFINHRLVLVDCFESGKALEPAEVPTADIDSVQTVLHILEAKTPAEIILARVLRNLHYAYNQVEDYRASQLMAETLQLHESLLKNREKPSK